MRLLTPILLTTTLITLTGCPAPAPPTPATWAGHVVPFHLPVDAGLAGATSAKPAAKPGGAGKLLLGSNGRVRVNSERLDDWSADTPAAIGQAVKQRVAQGTTTFEIDAGADVPAWNVIAAMAACRANGIANPTVAAGAARAPDFGPGLKSDGETHERYVAPPLPRVAGAEQRELPAEAVSIMILDAGAKGLAVEAPGRPRVFIGTQDAARHFKGQAKRLPVKNRPGMSDLAVLVTVQQEAPWSWLAWVLEECAKAGIWKIEVVVEPGK